MTTIDRLGLTGIRSYGADQETFIRFYRPLTIILGRNGSGKSTIIEAVKMATTGDLPPMVEKGAAFIHDPRIDNETETKAKIRLQFTNGRGDKYVVSRHFLLSIKRGLRGAKYKTEFKTLDQTLKLTVDEGPSSSTSYRCADLNALLPEIMRVTKPILNNVIFVHQEESLWPLGDPKKLKEKFDDIFASTRYTKALETIRKFRKEQSADLRVLNSELTRFEERVQLLDKLRNEAERMRVDQDKLRRGERQLDAEFKELQRQDQEAHVILQDFAEKKNALVVLEKEVSMFEESQKRLERQMSLHIKDLDDAGLRAERQRLEERLCGITGEFAERQRAISELRVKKERKEADLHPRRQKQGALQQSELLHKKNLEVLEAMKRRFHEENFLNSGFVRSGGNASDSFRSLLTPDSSTEEWSSALAQFLQDAESMFARINTEKEEALSESRAAVNDATVHVSTANNSISAKRNSRKNHGIELERVLRLLQGMGNAQTRFKESKEREAIARKNFEEMKSSSVIPELEKENELKGKEYAALRDELAIVRQQRDQLVKDEELRTKLEVFKETIQRTELDLKTAMEVLSDKLVVAKGEVEEAENLVPNYIASDNPISVDNMGSVDLGNADDRNRQQDALMDGCANASRRKNSVVTYLNGIVADLTSKVNSANGRQSLLKKQAEDLEAKIRTQEVALARARKDLFEVPRVEESPAVEDLTAMFQHALVVSDGSGCGMSPTQVGQVELTVKNVDQEVTAAQQRSSLSLAYARFAQADLDKFESNPKHICPTCGLSSAKKVESMRKRMQEKVARHKNPSEQGKEEEVIEKLQSTSVALKKVRNEGSLLVSIVATYESTKKELVDATTAVQNADKSFREMSALARRVQDLFAPHAAISQLEMRRMEVSRLTETLQRNAQDLSLAKDSLPPSTSGQHSMTEVNERMSVVELRMRHLQDERDNISRSLVRERSSLDDANQRLLETMRVRGIMQEQASECVRAEGEKERLNADIRKLDEEIVVLLRNLEDLKSAKTDAELTHSAVVAEHDRALEKASRVLANAKDEVAKWQDLTQKVSAFSRSGNKNELVILLKSICDIEADIKSYKEDLEALQREEHTSLNSDREIKSSMENIDTNMLHRQNEQTIRIKRRSMMHLQDDLNRIRGQVAGGDPQTSVNEIRDKMTKCMATLGATRGKFQQITTLYKLKKEEQVGAERDGSRKLYDECRIQKQTMELASVDLDKYHRALDQALMAFHTLKMNSINRIIKELWQQTYRGTDIDEIEITSDAGEALGSGSSSGTRRSYNYRVMMRQGQAQLDMRGRCSAGQKVLACLVIRLALAESFCTDCGILALDEPTTNLDHENIESLAFALKKIIEQRRKQRNFQLVLITHDREFIDMIGARDFADEFFMVYKDSDGISHAKVQDLTELPD